MISERELIEAINECQKSPITYQSCEKLANFLIVYDHFFGTKYNDPPRDRQLENKISVEGESEFLQKINGMTPEKVWSVLDELLETLRITEPRLYNGVIRRLDE